jgi:hypothetical protein
MHVDRCGKFCFATVLGGEKVGADEEEDDVRVTEFFINLLMPVKPKPDVTISDG